VKISPKKGLNLKGLDRNRAAQVKLQQALRSKRCFKPIIIMGLGLLGILVFAWHKDHSIGSETDPSLQTHSTTLALSKPKGNGYRHFPQTTATPPIQPEPSSDADLSPVESLAPSSPGIQGWLQALFKGNGNFQIFFWNGGILENLWLDLLPDLPDSAIEPRLSTLTSLQLFYSGKWSMLLSVKRAHAKNFQIFVARFDSNQDGDLTLLDRDLERPLDPNSDGWEVIEGELEDEINDLQAKILSKDYALTNRYIRFDPVTSCPDCSPKGWEQMGNGPLALTQNDMSEKAH